MTHLFLCQIGPVQSFIAAGRRTQDLYVGSRLLSQLARAGLYAISNAQGLDLIFPSLIDGDLPNNVPHRFAFLCDENPIDVAQEIENAIHHRWQNGYVTKVKDGLGEWIKQGKQRDIFERQTANSDWIEFYWVAVEYTDDYQACYKQANIALAQRKLLRHFPQVHEEGRKCTLTGAQSSLFPDNKQDADVVLNELRKQFHDNDGVLFRNNEYLGSLALIKRLADHKTIKCDLGNIPINVRSSSDIAGISREQENKGEIGYLAVLHMDGDRIGRIAEHFKTLDQHSKFSTLLAQFSEQVRDVVQSSNYGGVLVYSGGDDVLALLPLKSALSCAMALQEKFKAMLKDFANQLRLVITMSAGIAITPHDFPLDLALDMARQAEEKAKEVYGRDAIVVTEAHGTGTIREAGGNWEIVDLMNTLIGYFADDTLSGKLGYDIQTIAHDMGGAVPPEAREAELIRIIKRRSSEKLSTDDKKHLSENLGKSIANLAEQRLSGWQDMAHWIILARFIAKPTQEKAGA